MVAVGLLLCVIALHNFQSNYIFLFLMLYLIYIATFSYKIRFIENDSVIFYRLLGNRQIKLCNIIRVTKGTHKNRVHFENSAINISHLIDNVDTLTNLIEKSVHSGKTIITEAKIEDFSIREDASSSDLVKIAVRVLIFAIITSVIGIIFSLEWQRIYLISRPYLTIHLKGIELKPRPTS